MEVLNLTSGAIIYFFSMQILSTLHNVILLFEKKVMRFHRIKVFPRKILPCHHGLFKGQVRLMKKDQGDLLLLPTNHPIRR